MQKIVGAFIFPDVWQQWDEAKAGTMFDALAGMGVNTICTESETYRDDLIELCHRQGLQWFGGISCFSEHAHQHQLLKERPELWPMDENGARRPQMEWYLGVTPTFDDYNAERLALAAQLVSAHDLDGFFLDFIRWPIHWELELRPGEKQPLQSSFDPHTLACFQDRMGITLPHDLTHTAEKARWILSNCYPQWVDFKCRTITGFVRQAAERLTAIRPGLALGMFVLPMPLDDLESIAGQRLSDLVPLVDWIAPMVYHAILHRDIGWAVDMVGITAGVAGDKTLPVLQVDSSEGAEMGADWGPPVPVSEWNRLLELVLGDNPARGLLAFTGTALFREQRGRTLLYNLRKTG